MPPRARSHLDAFVDVSTNKQGESDMNRDHIVGSAKDALTK